MITEEAELDKQEMEAEGPWEIERKRVEALRLKHAPDEAPWKPAAPNTPPVARPGWLMRAQAAESKARERELAAAEAERVRRGKHDVTRGEFEDLLIRLRLFVPSAEAEERRAGTPEQRARFARASANPACGGDGAYGRSRAQGPRAPGGRGETSGHARATRSLGRRRDGA